MQRRTLACRRVHPAVSPRAARRRARRSPAAALLTAALAAFTALAAPPAARAESAAAPGADRPTEGEPPSVATALFIVGVDLEIAGRSLTYSDLLSDNLRSYSVLGVPMPAIRGELFPLARSRLPVLSDLGVALSYARAIGLDSEGDGGASVSTSWSRLRADLRGRYRPLGDAGPVAFASAGLSWTGYDVEAGDDPSRDVVSVSYTALRLGLDGRLPAGPVAVEAGAGLQVPLSTGKLASYFREPSAAGVDLRAAVAVPFAPRLEARAGASYTRFFYDFDSEPGDMYVAGGALDQLFSLHVGVAYAY
ncbi:hypothetical protein [Sorangium cellulosum]|uniref:hypothetical protein n=1 Tax=Sorangium cellulosum TaxID=56 RepID=UPI001F467150|nr:hypothetical protein [Sorangium cellulosum]